MKGGYVKAVVGISQLIIACMETGMELIGHVVCCKKAMKK